MSWKPIKSAPFMEIIEVRNEQMEHPVLATRGHSINGAVHSDNTFCTTVFTPDTKGFFPTLAGNLVCPTEWRTPISADVCPHCELEKCRCGMPREPRMTSIAETGD